MTAHEILQHWLTYTKYDPEQKSFNLLSTNYAFNRASKEMAAVMEYDPSGTIAVLYAKDFYIHLCKESKITLYDLFTDSDTELAADREMWNFFMSEDVTAVEKQFLDAINALTSQVIDVKQIGERDLEKERAVFFDSITSVTEELTKCKTSLYLRGGPVQKIQNFSTKIHIFERLADCLLALEQAPDGMYLCYVNCGGTADGYFGFYVKSNGTILSLSERIDEAYPGQHKNSRNGRWAEDKKYNLFPYNYIFSFSEHDYLGYAKKHTIDDSKLAFCNLEPQAYMPLILAMVMTANKFSGAEVSDMPVMLIDSLFQRNLYTALPESRALIVPSDSALAAVSRDYIPTVTTPDILGTDMAKKLTDKSRPYYDRGTFDTADNIFVELYGKGFELDTSKLLVADPHLKMLTSEERQKNTDLTSNAEFVGSEDRMEVIAYMQGRQQLAEYIREQMLQEYLAAGGAEGVRIWWEKAMEEHKDGIFKSCVQKYLDKQKNEKELIDGRLVPPLDAPGLRYVYFEEDCRGKSNNIQGAAYPYNNFGRNRYGRADTNKLLCPITGASTSIVFMFRPDTWQELEELFGEIPKSLKGWLRNGHYTYGNTLLDATDAVSGVGTPFEYHEQQVNKLFWHKYQWSQIGKERPKVMADVGRPQTEFTFGVAFSKRGFAKLIKGFQ